MNLKTRGLPAADWTSAAWLQPEETRAFTFIELLVILAVLAMGTALMLPAVDHTRPGSQAVQCLSNHRQLMTAWEMYAADYQGILVSNSSSAGPTGPIRPYPTWACGWQDWLSGIPSGANTNMEYLSGAKLGPYSGSKLSIYKCPADVISSAVGQRARSVSMNGFLGDNWEQRIYGYTTYRVYFKESDLTAPRPSQTFVFTDEHPDSINDCILSMKMPSVSLWPMSTIWDDVPASYHNGGCGLSFADGHAELHRWVDSVTRAPILKASLCSAYAKNSPIDNAWLVARTSAPK